MTVMSEIEAADIRALREQILERGGRTAGISGHMFQLLLERTNDVDLAATALLMDPRPAWVSAIVPGGGKA